MFNNVRKGWNLGLLVVCFAISICLNMFSLRDIKSEELNSI